MTEKARQPKTKAKTAVNPKAKPATEKRDDELSIEELSKVAGGRRSRRTRVMPIRK
jgi:hypothetical protein